MNLKLKQLLAILFTFASCTFFGFMLFSYTVPMDNLSLDLSLGLPDGASEEDFDEKGWTVFVQEGEEVTELESNGFGGYTGLELGQTFYFSRVLEESMDAPTLQLGVVDRSISVFLDGDLIYTDCPELDNRIGYLTLPMYGWDRMEQLTIFLPEDYLGKVLTIAQSTPDYTEVASVCAFPCEVKLYCGYAYESELIAESFQTGYLCLALFFIGLILLIFFAFKQNVGSLFIGLSAFLGMIQLLTETSFFHIYFGESWNPLNITPLYLLTGVILLALSLFAEKGRKLMLVLTGVYGAALLAGILIQLQQTVLEQTSRISLSGAIIEWSAAIALLIILIMSIFFWRKENSFYRMFTPLALGAELLCWGYSFITQKDAVSMIILSLKSGQVTYIYYRLLVPLFLVALVTTLTETIRSEAARQMEKRLIEQQHDMALASYKNLHTHHQEVMMLRHDMLHHYHALSKMNDENQMKDYLTTLIGQNEKIRPVLQSGNEMLDIILNGKLSAAMDAGIKVDIIRAEAPGQIPMKNADLCSLIMNIIDNAINAASKPQVHEPLIRLDIHVKSDYLMFICENTANFEETVEEKPEKVHRTFSPHAWQEKTVSKHGLGLKIIRNIINHYNGLIDTEVSKDRYCIRIGIPLN